MERQLARLLETGFTIQEKDGTTHNGTAKDLEGENL